MSHQQTLHHPYRASPGFGGVAETFIAYLGPCFLHVPLLQVVSRELWHQLEQPNRREMRAQHQLEVAGENLPEPPDPFATRSQPRGWQFHAGEPTTRPTAG